MPTVLTVLTQSLGLTHLEQIHKDPLVMPYIHLVPTYATKILYHPTPVQTTLRMDQTGFDHVPIFPPSGGVPWWSEEGNHTELS